jgi:hypothetical protein
VGLAGLFSAGLLVLVFWTAQFRPLLFDHQNLMGYRLLDTRITGLPPGAQRRSIFNRLPSQDASLLVLHFPYQVYLADQFHRGVFPLWNPLVGCGMPVASDPQYKPWNPFFWPFFAWPSAWSFSLGIALMALFGALGFVLFLRLAGLGWAAAAFAGILMAFNPMTEQTIVLSSSWAAWVFPWGLVGLELWRRGRRFGLPLAASAAALMVYAGHPMIALLYFCILSAYLWLRPGDIPAAKRLRAFGLLVGLVFLATAVHTVPLLANMGRYWSYKSLWNGGPYNQWLALSNPKSEIYVPLPIWGLALVGLACGMKRLRWFFVGTCAYGTVVMFPWIGQGPVRWLMTFGGVLVARYGEEAFWFGLLGLSALGIEALASGGEAMARWRQLRYFVYGVTFYYVLAYVTMDRGSFYWPDVFKKLHWLEIAACLPVVLTLLFPAEWTVWRRAATLCFFPLAAVPFMLPMNMSRYFSNLDLSLDPPPLVQAIKKEKSGFPMPRITGGFYEGHFMADLCPNQNLCWNLPDIRIASPLLLKGYEFFSHHWGWADLFGTLCFMPRQDAALLDFLGVRWAVAEPGKTRPPGKEVTSANGLVLREVDAPSPWVRAVGRWTVGANDADAWRRTFAAIRSGDWRGEAVLQGHPPPSCASPATWRAPHLAWVEGGPNRWRWTLDGRQASMLLILMNAHPGWHARVDGAPARIYRAYGTFQAVYVPPGRHEVTLVFRAPWFWFGLGLSVFGWVILLTWFVGLVGRDRHVPS